MVRSPDEMRLVEEFDATYLRSGTEVMHQIERSVLNTDYGATSWTTRTQADQLAALLKLGPGIRMIDVGAGSGWPGLHLARTTGCEAFIVDPSYVGIRVAADRASADHIADRCGAVVADGGALPFTDGVFDAVNHADVLC
ncbi:MAG: class I SAM-dependent methyltransferase [Acidimicrobiia bacterium]